MPSENTRAGGSSQRLHPQELWAVISGAPRGDAETSDRKPADDKGDAATDEKVTAMAIRSIVAIVCVALMPLHVRAAEPERAVVVNGVALAPYVVRALENHYRTPIAPGRYWYDSFSGAWGLEGGPLASQIQPGLRLGGPLRADASRGNTGVFVNGRQLHALDVAALSRCTTVIPGRYWVAANGVGGYENGPPIFNLAALCAPKGGGSSTRCSNYGNGQYSCNNSNTGVGVIGEGGGKGAVVWGGKVITTPN